MPCANPQTCYLHPSGGITFNRRIGYADRPILKPCGWCAFCRRQKARSWTVRCYNESQCHQDNSFITLTYSPEKIPRNGSLAYSHFQSFAKNLRNKGIKFRFYMCGEYGEQNHRPHYHAILFGVDFTQPALGGYPWRIDKGNTFCRSPVLEDCWPYGFSEAGSVHLQTIAYTANYVSKKIIKGKEKNYFDYVCPQTGTTMRRVSELNRMSLKPGIGMPWLEKNWRDVFPADHVIVGERQYPVPKAYTDWLKENHPQVHEEVILNRRRGADDERKRWTTDRRKTQSKCIELNHKARIYDG